MHPKLVFNTFYGIEFEVERVDTRLGTLLDTVRLGTGLRELTKCVN